MVSAGAFSGPVTATDTYLPASASTGKHMTPVAPVIGAPLPPVQKPDAARTSVWASETLAPGVTYRGWY